MESMFLRTSSHIPVPADVAVHKKPPDSSPPVGRHMFVKKVGRLFNCRKLSLQNPGLLTSECGDNLYSRFSPDIQDLIHATGSCLDVAENERETRFPHN